jgi:betaine-aldehyde dehydrogenase
MQRHSGLQPLFSRPNDFNVTPPEIPFGGYKESGLGRENGLEAIERYTQTKTIYTNLGDVEKTY